MERKNINVSIIIPFYNAQAYVKSCLDSIIKIDALSVEIICVDDGSTDDTVKLLEEYRSKDSRIVILQQDNLYAGVARNNGMKIAKGKYITFIDADDELLSVDTLYKAYNLAEENCCDLLACSAIGGNDIQSALPEYFLLKTQYLPTKKVFNAKDLGIYATYVIGGVPWGKLFRREFLEEYQLEFLSLPRSEDFVLIELAVCLAKRISWLDEALIFHRKNVPGSLENTKDKTPTIIWKACLLEVERFVKLGIWQEVQAAFKLSTILGLEYHLNAMNTLEGFNAIFKCEKEEAWPFLQSIKAEPEDEGYRRAKERLERILEYASGTDYLLANGLVGGKDLINLGERLIKTAELKSQFGKLDCGDGELSLKKKQGVKVSVIIPVYNVEKYLPLCLESVINQSLKEIEIICVDDASEDGSNKVLQEYSHRDNRIIVLKQANNQGPSVARNLGCELAIGEFIYFLDSDDIIELDAMEQLYLKATEEKLDLICFDGRTIFEDENLFRNYNWLLQWCGRGQEYVGIKTGKQLMVEMYENDDYKSVVGTLFIRRNFIVKEKLHFKPGMIYENTLFVFECMLKAVRASHNFEKYYIRRVRYGALTITEKANIMYPYSLFCSALAMIRLTHELELFGKERETANKEIFHILREAKEQLKRLGPEEFHRYLEFSADNRIVFENLVVNPVLNECLLQNQKSLIAEKEEEIQIARRRTEEVGIHLMDIKNGWSFRIGRVLTWLPRRLMGKE